MADEDKKYVITNPGRAPRTIYDAGMQPVRIEARGGVRRNVSLSKVIVDELRGRADGEGGDMELQVEDQKGDGAGQGGVRKVRDQPRGAAANSDEANRRAAEAANRDGAARKKRADDAAKLADKAEAMDFNDFREQAKGVLGDDYPPGNVSRDDLVGALRKVKA